MSILVLVSSPECATKVLNVASPLLKLFGMRGYKITTEKSRMQVMKDIVFEGKYHFYVGTIGRILDLVLNEPVMQKRLGALQVVGKKMV